MEKLSEAEIARIQQVYDSEFMCVAELSRRVGLHYKQLHKLRDSGKLDLYRDASTIRKMIVSRNRERMTDGLRKWLASTEGQSRRKLSEATKQKLREAAIRRLKEGRDKESFSRNHSSRESYAERFVRRFLRLRGITFEQQSRVRKYKLDFLVGDINLEVDGYTHRSYQSVIDKDRVRDAFLAELGLRVVRLDWTAFQKMDRMARKMYMGQILLQLENAGPMPDSELLNPRRKCPICGAPIFTPGSKTCSVACGKELVRRHTGKDCAGILREGEDVMSCTLRVYNECGRNLEAAGRILGVSGNAVKKRLKKLA